MSLLSTSDKHTLYEKFRPFLKPSWKLDSAHYEMRSAGDDDGWSKFHRGGDIRKHIISRKSSFHRLHGLAKKNEWNQSIFDEINKASEKDIGTAWKNNITLSSSRAHRSNYKGMRADNDLCTLWRNYYADPTEEPYHQEKCYNNFTKCVDDCEKHERNITGSNSV